MDEPLDLELEDGEIFDAEDVEEVYVPLERPMAVIPVAVSVANVEDLSDREDQSSSSDSDDSQRGRMRAKLKKKQNRVAPKVPAPQPKRKNYNIWNTDITEETLTTTLNKCTVDQEIDRSRDVESYNHLLAVPHLNEVKKVLRETLPKAFGTGKASNKRSHGGRFVDEKRKSFVGNPQKKKNKESHRREIPALNKGVDDTPEDLAADIANKLFEGKEEIILQAINVLGKEMAISIFEETRGIERSGGLLIMNGERRRTPGGVYFYLLKCSGRFKKEEVEKIFGDDRKMAVAEKRKTAKEARLARAAKRKEALKSEDYRTLLSKAEAAILKLKDEEQHEPEDGGVKNPPPSPATDGKDNSSDGEEQKSDLLHDLMDI